MMRSIRTLLKFRPYYNGSKVRPLCTKNEDEENTLRYYKEANEEAIKIEPEGWNEAKPFDQIPGPGTTDLLAKYEKIFQKDFLEITREFHEKYGDIAIMKNVMGENIVMIFNTDDFEKLYDAESTFPIRPNFPSLDNYLKLRKGKVSNFGLVSNHGEKWFKLRSFVNPILLKPENAKQYVDKMNPVADDLISNIRYFSEQNPEGEMPEDFQTELYKWSLESIATVTLDTRLGCLERNLDPNSEANRTLKALTTIPDLTYKLDLMPSRGNPFETPDYQLYCECFDYLVETNQKHLDAALAKMEREKSEGSTKPRSVLQQMLQGNKQVASSIALDMLFAGVDSTGRILGATLYYLSKHPEKQAILSSEARSLLKHKDSPVTREILDQAQYLKAVFDEALRLSPTAVATLRKTQSKLVLAGYQIPANSTVMSCNLLLCYKDEHFPRAKQFLPERWLDTAPEEISSVNSHYLVYMPFGHGARTCIGRRFASVELETAMLKIARNFEMKWPHEDMVFSTSMLHGIARPLKIQFKPLKVV